MKPMLKRYDPLVLVAWAYVFGAFFIALSVLTCATTPADWSFSPVSWAAIAYSAVFSSAAAYFLMAWYGKVEFGMDRCCLAISATLFRVNERSSPVVVSAFYPVQPIATIPLSWAVLGQVMAPVARPTSIWAILYSGRLFLTRRCQPRASTLGARQCALASSCCSG